MSTVIVRRTHQPDPPQLPQGEIVLQSPPEIPEVTQDTFRQTLMYLPMLAMTVGMVAMIAGPHATPVQYVGGGAMALGMGGMTLSQIGRGRGERRTKLDGLRRTTCATSGSSGAGPAGRRPRSGRHWSGPARTRTR
jgi:S-DNA-T family DNA segregation ATPase FtsK/SpoIIIE